MGWDYKRHSIRVALLVGVVLFISSSFLALPCFPRVIIYVCIFCCCWDSGERGDGRREEGGGWIVRIREMFRGFGIVGGGYLFFFFFLFFWLVFLVFDVLFWGGGLHNSSRLPR